MFYQKMIKLFCLDYMTLIKLLTGYRCYGSKNNIARTKILIKNNKNNNKKKGEKKIKKSFLKVKEELCCPQT